MRAAVLDGSGFSFNPFDYRDQIQEIVAEWIIGGFIGLIDAIAGGLETIFDEALIVLGDAQSIVLMPFGLIGDAILVFVNGIDSILIGAAGALGPLSPLVFVLAFVIMLGIGALSVRVVIEIVRFI